MWYNKSVGILISEGRLTNTFKRGVHPHSFKWMTAGVETRVMPAPETVYIPVSQHIGKPAVPVVAPGDAVKRGQKIAAADGTLSAPVFSSVSGTVKGIETRVTAGGKCAHIVIANDGRYDTVSLPVLTDPTKEEIIRRVADCGIVGMGGAGFPTAVKLDHKTSVDTFIINAAECEPFITCDYRLLTEQTAAVLDGALLLAKAAGVNHATIAIEDNKRDAAELVAKYIADNNLNAETVIVKTKYPQGAEKQLVYAVTGRKVPVGKLPGAVGCIVCNVHTAFSTHQAVRKGQPLYERYMTVSGQGVKTPSNLLVAVGTLYADAIAFCGGDGEPVKLISGGPMMGVAVAGAELAVTKTSGSLLLLTRDEAFTGQPGPCINCGKCAKACPMRLMPMYIDGCILAGDVDGSVKYGAKNCIECGCCAYVCPAKRPLVQSIRLAKKKIKGARK